MVRVNQRLRDWAAVKTQTSGADGVSRRGGPPEAIGSILGRIKPADPASHLTAEPAGNR